MSMEEVNFRAWEALVRISSTSAGYLTKKAIERFYHLSM